MVVDSIGVGWVGNPVIAFKFYSTNTFGFDFIMDIKF